MGCGVGSNSTDGHVPTRRSQEAPDLKVKHTLLLEDGSKPIETDTFDEFRAQLRRRYPDKAYERRLRVERNREAEEAARELTRIFAEMALSQAFRSVADELMRMDAEGYGAPTSKLKPRAESRRGLSTGPGNLRRGRTPTAFRARSLWSWIRSSPVKRPQSMRVPPREESGAVWTISRSSNADLARRLASVGSLHSSVASRSLANRRAGLVRKLQCPLNRLKARLLAQGVQERVGLQIAPGPGPAAATPSRAIRAPSPDCPTAHRSWRTGTPRHRPVLPSVSQARLPHPRAGRACHRPPRDTVDSPSRPASSRMRRARSQDPRARNRRSPRSA